MNKKGYFMQLGKRGLSVILCAGLILNVQSLPVAAAETENSGQSVLSTVSGGNEIEVSSGDSGTVSSGDSGTVSGTDAGTVSGADSGTVSGADAGTVSGTDGTEVSSGNEGIMMLSLEADPYAWYTDNPDASEFSIYTAEELYALAELVNTGVTDIHEGSRVDFTGRTIRLEEDIVLNEDMDAEGKAVWKPIGTESIPFQGCFDGQNHTISGLYISSFTQNQGLFGCVTGTETALSVIKNVRLSNSRISGSECVGGIAGQISYTNIENCKADSTVSVSASGSYGRAGGLVGYARISYSECSITECTNEALQNYPNLLYIGGMAEDKLRVVYDSGMKTVRLQFDVGGGSWADYYFPGSDYNSGGNNSGVALYFEADEMKYQYNTQYFRNEGVNDAIVTELGTPQVAVSGTILTVTWPEIPIGETEYKFDFTMEYSYNGGGTMNRRYIITPRGTDLTNVKLSYGGDTYFAGDDYGYDYAIWYEGSAGDSTKMLFIKQSNLAESPAMYISSTTADGYFAGGYYDGMSWGAGLTGTKQATNGSERVDESYYLYWELGNLPGGYSTMVTATEGVDQSGTPLRAFAPNIPTFVAGDNADQIETVNFVIANLTGDAYEIENVTVSSDEGSGVTAEYIGQDRYEVPASGSVLLPLEIRIPAHTPAQEVNVTVSASDNEGNHMEVTTTLDIRIRPSVTNVRLDGKKITFDTANVDKYEIYKEGAAVCLAQVNGGEALGTNRLYTVPEYGTYYIYAYQGTLCVQCQVVVSEPSEENEYFTLTYNYEFNGGYGVNQAVQTKNVRVLKDTVVDFTAENAETANKSGWEFVGWNTDKTAVAALEKVQVDGNLTVYALYQKSVTANFHHNDGTEQISEASVTLYNNESAKSVNIPEAPERAGYQFEGFYTARENGRKLTGETVLLNADRDYYAVWELAPIVISQVTEDISEMYSGETIRLALQAQHAMPVTYQWYKGEQPVAGADKAFLELSGTVADSGVYTCKASVSDGDDTVTAQRSVKVSISRFSYQAKKPVVTMQGYEYAKAQASPGITGVKDGAEVTFYYHTQNANTGGSPWASVDSSTALTPGAYYMYAAVSETQNCEGTVTAPVRFEIEKGTQTPPAAPTENSAERTTNSVTLVPLEGCEYSKDGENWQDSHVFQGLEPGTTYRFFQRKSETENYKHSLPGPAAEFRPYGIYEVSLPTVQTGYTLNPAQGSSSPVVEGGSYLFVLEVQEGYSRQENFAVKVNGIPVLPDSGGIYRIENVTEKKSITVEGIADITLPTGNIQIRENNWNQFLNQVTFGLFFRETQSVTITGSDAGSGIGADGICYYLAQEPLTKEEIAAVPGEDWQVYRSSFPVNPNNRYVIYARITDDAGNRIYINSDGIVLDDTAPVVAEPVGTTDSATGKYTVTVKVEDSQGVISQIHNYVSVTKSGIPVEYTVAAVSGGYEIVFERTENTDYVITVKDEAGNTAEKVISMPEGSLHKVCFQAGDGAQGTAPGGGEYWQFRKWRLPENTFTKEDSVFCGWEYNGKIYKASEEFTMPGEDVVFTAKWSAAGGAAQIYGNVVFENQKVPEAAQVQLWEDSVLLLTQAADKNGNFSLAEVPNGIYTLEVIIPDTPVNQVLRQEITVLDGKLVSNENQVIDNLVVTIPKAAGAQGLEEKIERLTLEQGGVPLLCEELKEILENGSVVQKEQVIAQLREDARRSRIQEALEAYHDLSENKRVQVDAEKLQKLDLFVKGTCDLSVELRNSSSQAEAPGYENLLGLLITPEEMEEQWQSLLIGESYTMNICMTIHTLYDGEENEAIQNMIEELKRTYGSGYIPDGFYDVTILKTINGDESVVKKTPEEIELRFLMSQSMLSGSSYEIWRYHEEEGSAEILSLASEQVGGIQKTGSDRFSVFAVVYRPAAVTAGYTGAGQESEKADGRQLDKVPKTGEAPIDTKTREPVWAYTGAQSRKEEDLTEEKE